MELRDLSQKKLKSLYSQLYSYYKENEYDKNKIKSLKQTIKSFDNTILKNNMLTELMEIYTITVINEISNIKIFNFYVQKFYLLL